MAAMRRVSTCCRDSRQAPRAGSTAKTTLNSSGSSDMVSAMPANKAAIQLPLDSPNITTKMALASRPIDAST